MQLISASEAARYLHLNVKRIQALARSGRLPGRRVGRKWLFDRRDLDNALGSGEGERWSASTSAPAISCEARSPLLLSTA